MGKRIKRKLSTNQIKTSSMEDEKKYARTRAHNKGIRLSILLSYCFDFVCDRNVFIPLRVRVQRRAHIFFCFYLLFCSLEPHTDCIRSYGIGIYAAGCYYSMCLTMATISRYYDKINSRTSEKHAQRRIFAGKRNSANEMK